jgi:hypothetical protein
MWHNIILMSPTETSSTKGKEKEKVYKFELTSKPFALQKMSHLFRSCIWLLHTCKMQQIIKYFSWGEKKYPFTMFI